ncbi:hypothetical protein Aab01nite_56760 [Paractinoplanes abujensis]|uniref:Uncharacterized protein n=1 Tax=Paractinoplanes abujensis TaxID=882441 RepID=A0A7W7CZV5_9ACTN|nr:hypothetical protein [Actinoplanes abujensis]MBB4696096.1 hypothetical protein [Actinoplanes abujensis]GID22086.1 hypothetical protein Aab01nite_56760 [Actinoplanes abujensis]
MADAEQTTDADEQLSRMQLGRLADPDPRVRELAADEAGDQLRRRGLDQKVVETAVARLVEASLVEQDGRALESALNACSDAASVFELPLPIVEPLTSLAPRLPCGLIGYVVQILASTHDPKARTAIAAYADHPDLELRRATDDALIELAGRQASWRSPK